MKATVTYCEATANTYMLRLGFESGSAQFELPKTDFLGGPPDIGSEVEVQLRLIPKPKPAVVPEETVEQPVPELSASSKSVRPHR